MMLRGKYETSFGDALRQTIRTGDRVWDVGANVGYYTRQFSAWVGPEGIVFAFEPSPLNASRLRTTVGHLSNVRIKEVALGADNGIAHISQGSDDTGATSKLVNASSAPSTEGVPVNIHTGLTLVQSGQADPPNVLKIDTEGYELDVVSGLGSLLGSRALRAIFVEVHFGLLAARGQPAAPAELESLLERTGFRVRWIDASHVEATRRP
jgi:FkbM family methyltransferase